MKTKKTWLRSQAQPCSENWQPAPKYRYAELDDAPLIIDFEQQLTQQREVEGMLRHIAAVIDFELACLTRGVDPRASGEG